jgi:hypothetical protein
MERNKWRTQFSVKRNCRYGIGHASIVSELCWFSPYFADDLPVTDTGASSVRLNKQCPTFAVPQVVSHLLPTAKARVRAQVRSYLICGGLSGTGAGFIRVLRFPLPIIDSTDCSTIRAGIKNGVFWDVTPCGSCKNRRFGGTWRLLHQGDKNR